MRRAGHHGIVSRPAARVGPRNGSTCSAAIAPLELKNSSSVEMDEAAERHRHLESVIRQRIEARLPGRLRNLVVRIADDTVLLEGQCATYYTKQIAQDAAMGVLEDEHLENAIVVAVAR